MEKTVTLSLLKDASVRKLLDDVLTWRFDVIALESHCKLQYVTRFIAVAMLLFFNVNIPCISTVDIYCSYLSTTF